MSYDTNKSKVKYVVTLKNNSFVGMGYGTGMGSKSNPTDMVLFQANGD